MRVRRVKSRDGMVLGCEGVLCGVKSAMNDGEQPVAASLDARVR